MAYTTIDDPSVYFQTLLYTGNGSSSRALTNDGNSDLQPDWLWVKNRSNAVTHGIWDSSRGAGKRLTIATDAEEDQTNVASFNSDGFTVNTGDIINTNSHTYVAWQWKANGGSVTTVSESGDNPGHTRQTNTTAGFSIIKYTGTGAVGTIAHGLGIVPDFIILKRLENADNWRTYDSIGGGTKSMRLNLTGGHGTSSSFFNDTDATSSNFTVGTNSEINGDAETYIAYVFGSIQGYSKIGKYTGNGNADGPFIYTGFKPAWLMIKVVAGNTGGWDMYDNKRGSYNGQISMLQANANSTEATSDGVDFLSNGFKIKHTSGNQNGSGNTHIYIAFAEHPFVSSKGVPVTAR